MKEKGFTLIELLAVIVVLAIIAMIAIPIILNIINDTKKSSIERSKELYLDAVEQAIARKNLESSFNPTTCTVVENGNLSCDVGDLNVETKGQTPKVGGTITIQDGKITSNTLEFGGSNNSTISKSCRAITGNGTAIGDIINCAGEEFYVMENDGANIKMFARYNLNVGDYLYPGAAVGIQNENVRGATLKDPACRINGTCQNLDEMIQDENVPVYGTVKFSDTAYWGEYSGDISQTAFVYDSRSNVYKYIENYETYLKNQGVKSVDATILDYQYLNQLQTKCLEGNCIFADGVDASYLEGLILSTSYWMGQAICPYTMYGICLDDNCSTTLNSYEQYSYDKAGGVRPLVIISANELS